ncbi:glycosyltransferase [Phycicoccus sp.]|uniref:glycosyltransferase n=1 Tax=Phycicoccus sp. TaxID=1902410 RepID=UPI002BB1DD2E|nr:glycosyltransferase [Phycicoccus sp.]HMM96551.1 glycosyltransferase [Phycicoccus sp.]
MSRVAEVLVVVPARDEEAVLGACLESVGRAGRRLAQERPDVRLEVVVVLDACLDGSAAVAGRYPVTVLGCAAGRVGAARRRGVEFGLGRALGREVPASAVWVANTDADSEVPDHWLIAQLLLAEAGHDLVVGSVEPADGLEPAVLAAWHARHQLREGHRHVHGANLGVRADAYLAAGGFPDLPIHEDVALVERVRATGRPWVATDRARVRASARRVGRAEGGFASYLAALTTPPGLPGERAG